MNTSNDPRPTTLLLRELMTPPWNEYFQKGHLKAWFTYYHLTGANFPKSPDLQITQVVGFSHIGYSVNGDIVRGIFTGNETLRIEWPADV